MSNFTLDDLAALGTPDIIETLDYETILLARKDRFVGLMPKYGIDYDVIDLETDPGVVLLEESAYSEIVLRARGNDIARARYLYFARGTEVDHLAAFYDVVRLDGETDARLKVRIILAIQSRSTGGTAPRYRSVAMGSSIRVADAYVYRDGLDPTVRIAVFATDNDGVADAGLLETVRQAVNAETIRMVNDTIIVRSAVVSVVAVAADIVLLPDTPESILQPIAAALPSQWVAFGGLGRDLTHDWLKAKIMNAGSGIYSVTITAPAASVVAAPYDAVRIGAVTLNPVGRSF